MVLVVILLAYRTHERLSQQTRLTFSISVASLSSSYDTSARLDGSPVTSGDRISIGRHKFAISDPKAESFSTNLFIWYGEHNLGNIALRRSTGILAVSIDPPAARLNIRGPEFELTLTNTTGMTSAVPADTYDVEAVFTHWKEQRNVVVAGGSTTPYRIAPKLGAVDLTCNEPGATFQLARAGTSWTLVDRTPMTISGLPEGIYTLGVAAHGDSRVEKFTVNAGRTNAIRIDFAYGEASFETEPDGAKVTSSDGREWGRTPLTLSKLKPGRWKFFLHRDGYLPAEAELIVAAEMTNSIRTNLVNASFATAMERVRRNMAETNFEAALFAVNEALRSQPGDPEAGATFAELTRRMKVLRMERQLAKARGLAQDGDTKGSLALLDELIKESPDNSEVKQMQANLRQQEQAKADEARPRLYFEEQTHNSLNTRLFDRQEVKVKGSLADLERKLVAALTNDEPAFKLLALKEPDPGMFFLQVMQPMKAAGWRRCDMVGGQTSEGETLLVFKVFEYAYAEAFSIRSLVGDNNEKNMVPIHESRLGQSKLPLLARRAEGIKLIRDRIRKVTGE
jgi:hypothetical protein